MKDNFGSKNKTWMMRKKITIYTCVIISSREIIRLKSVLLLLYLYMHLTKRSFFTEWNDRYRQYDANRLRDRLTTMKKVFFVSYFARIQPSFELSFVSTPLRSERRRFNLEPATNLEVIWFRFFYKRNQANICNIFSCSHIIMSLSFPARILCNICGHFLL